MHVYGVTFFLLTENLSAKKTYLKKGRNSCQVYDVVLVFLQSNSFTCLFLFTGVDTMASYEEVLHLIRYRNWHTVSLFDRKFKLVCSELNGRYVSNEFKVEVCKLM